MQERLYNMLMQKDEITWQSIIYDLVKSEQMDPWDIDISLLSKRYLETIKELEEHNFLISGKVILAASILLKLKAVSLIEDDLASFDSHLFQQEESLLDEDSNYSYGTNEELPKLLIKTPQARKRKIDINDLMIALNRALKVEDNRKIRKTREQVIRPVIMPTKKIDITKLIKDVYERIKMFFSKQKELTFDELAGNGDKESKILTFVPLLHLSNELKVDLEQEKPFGEIKIKLL